MFDHSTFENHTGTEYKIEILEKARPHRIKPFTIPKIHEETLEIEVDRLVHMGGFTT